MSIITKDIVNQRKAKVAREEEKERREIRTFLNPNNLATIAEDLILLVREYYLDRGYYPSTQLVDASTVTLSVVWSKECKRKLLAMLQNEVDDRISDISFEYHGVGGWVPGWQKLTGDPKSTLIHVRFDTQRLDV